MCFGLALHCRTKKFFNGNAKRPSSRLVVKPRSVCVLRSKPRNNANVKPEKRPNVKKGNGSKGKGRRTLLRGVALEASEEPVRPCAAQEDLQVEYVRLVKPDPSVYSPVPPLQPQARRQAPASRGRPLLVPESRLLAAHLDFRLVRFGRTNFVAHCEDLQQPSLPDAHKTWPSTAHALRSSLGQTPVMTCITVLLRDQTRAL